MADHRLRRQSINTLIGPCQELGVVVDALVEAAANADLVVLGLRRQAAGGTVFGAIPKRVASETRCAVLLIASRRG